MPASSCTTRSRCARGEGAVCTRSPSLSGLLALGTPPAGETAARVCPLFPLGFLAGLCLIVACAPRCRGFCAGRS